MIVRCTKCNSAYAVKDEKVANKKFAFTCPNCSNENIIDNKGPDFQEQRAALRAPAGRDKKEKTPISLKTAVHDEEFRQEPSFEEDFSIDESEDFSEKKAPETGKGETPDEDMEFDISFDEQDISMDDTEIAKIAADTEEDLDLSIGSDIEDLGDLEISDDLSTEPLDELEKKAMEDDTEDSLDLDDIPVYKGEDNGAPPREARPLHEELEEEILSDFEPMEDEAITLDEREMEELSGGDGFSMNEKGSGGGIKTEKVYSKEAEDEDESITIDLDSLDIDLEEGPDDTNDTVGTGGIINKKQMPKQEDEETITLDLDSLDIDLVEEETISRGEEPSDINFDSTDIFDDSQETRTSADEDENITLDLDSLDIPLEDTGEVKTGEVLDDDEKITLEDAGLTLDELTSDELSTVMKKGDAFDDEEDIKLSIDDIDPELDMDNIEHELHREEEIQSGQDVADERTMLESIDDLPEIDLDSFDDEKELSDSDFDFDTSAAKKRKPGKMKEIDDDLIDIDLDQKKSKKGAALFGKKPPDMVPHGTVNFSVDYSLRYSRINALLRLVGLYFIGLIPHFVVLTVYTVLSLILGFINNLVVISTREAVEDFADIQENTVRYYLSVLASMIGFVDETPIFAGRENIDFALQLKVSHPYRHSRLLALLRFSVAGILVITLPHLIILLMLGLASFLFYFMGIISVIITGRWPYFLFAFFTEYFRFAARVLSYIVGLVDTYPTFRFN